MKKIKVEIKTRNKFVQVYCGFSMRTALGIKNMLRRQDPRLHIMMVREV